MSFCKIRNKESRRDLAFVPFPFAHFKKNTGSIRQSYSGDKRVLCIFLNSMIWSLFRHAFIPPMLGFMQQSLKQAETNGTLSLIVL
jgi:hypothetical protein